MKSFIKQFSCILYMLTLFFSMTGCSSDEDETIPLEYGSVRKMVLGKWVVTSGNGSSTNRVLTFTSDGYYTDSSDGGTKKHSWKLSGSDSSSEPYYGGIYLDDTYYDIKSLGEGYWKLVDKNGNTLRMDRSGGESDNGNNSGESGGNNVNGTSNLSCPDSNHPHMIDLGLPSGTKWACCNVGATAPEGYGGYYAWGETSEKNVYNWDTYQYGFYDYDGDFSQLVNIGTDIAGTQYDVATAKLGSGWVMPSLAQQEELVSNTTSEWATVNGINGRKFTGSNGSTIFLPATGKRWSSDLYSVGSSGNYWSSSLDESYPYYAWYLYFNSGGVSTYYFDRGRGLSVRPVRK